MGASEEKPWYWERVEKLLKKGLAADEIAEKLPLPKRKIFVTVYEQESQISDNAIGEARWRNPEILHELYVEEGMSIAEIGEQLDCSDSAVSTWLDAYDMKKSTVDESDNKPWRDKDKLKNLYIEEGLNTSEVAQELNVSRGTVRRWLSKHNLSKRRERPWRDESLLRELYVDEGLETVEVAEKFDCHPDTVRTWLIRHDIDRTGKNSGPWTDKEVLEKKYVEEKKSVTEVSEEFGCTSRTISYWLARHGIQTRGTESKHKLINKNIDESIPDHQKKEVLEELHIKENKSISEIAIGLDCRPATLKKHLDRHDLLDEDTGDLDIDDIYELEFVSEDSIDDLRTAELHRNENLLKYLYIDENMSKLGISELLKCSPATVDYWLVEHDIEQVENQNEIERPEDKWLEEQYIEEQQSLWDIAQEVGCSQRQVKEWLQDIGIEIRGVSEVHINDKLKDEEKMREFYEEQELSVAKIAEKLNSSHSMVKYWLKTHNIELRSQREEISGEKNPHWKGGHAPYGKGWTKEKRKKVLERDDYRCQSCGMTNAEHKSQLDSSLHIHHIIPARRFNDPEKRNSLTNLVALCAYCHKDWEGIPVRPQFKEEI